MTDLSLSVSLSRSLSLTLSLSPLSFSLTMPHYTGDVSAASAVKATVRARLSADVLADASECLISFFGLFALHALNSASLDFSQTCG